MDTTAYLNYQMQVLEKFVDCFEYDDMGADYHFLNNENVTDMVKEFLEYYAFILGDNEIFVPELSDNDLFKTAQGQKLFEIIKCSKVYQTRFRNKEVTRENVYSFLLEQVNMRCSPYEIKLERIKKWFGRRRSTTDRITIFMISFGLDLPIEPQKESPQFCHKYLFNKVFRERYCLRTPEELCLMYAKSHQMSFSEAEDMYKSFVEQYNSKQIKNNSSINYSSAKNTKTFLAKTNDENIGKEEFLGLLNEYSDILDVCYTSVLEKIDEYKNEITETDFIKAILCNRDNIFSIVTWDREEQISNIEKRKQTIRTDDKILTRLKKYILYGGIDDRDKRKEIHNTFDFILKQNDLYIKPNKSTNSTFYSKIRKTLIYFHFLTYWINIKKDYSPCYDDYIYEINDLLNMYMLPPLYPFNKSDLFYIFCGKSNDPVSTYFMLLANMDEIIDE